MVRRFIGRTHELHALHNKLESTGFQMVAIYGGRRVGKTTLINRFVDESGATTVSFVALQRDEKEQLKSMGEAVLSSLAPELLGSVSFESFEKVFEFIAARSARERVV